LYTRGVEAALYGRCRCRVDNRPRFRKVVAEEETTNS
jgi:hypothetical protein